MSGRSCIKVEHQYARTAGYPHLLQRLTQQYSVISHCDKSIKWVRDSCIVVVDILLIFGRREFFRNSVVSRKEIKDNPRFFPIVVNNVFLYFMMYIYSII